MKIGIDCRSILNPEKGEAGGVGHYVYQLVRHLLQIDKKNKYVLFFDQKIKDKKLKKFSQENVKIIFHPFYLYSKFVPTQFSTRLYDAAIEKENLDVFHLPRLSNVPRRIKVRSVLTVHDLSVLRLPKIFSEKEINNEKNKLSLALSFVDRVITVSKSTQKDLFELFDFLPEKVDVIYHGLDERFLKRKTEKEIEEVKKKYNIKNNYLLFLSPLENRKNICRIVQAFDLLKEEINKDPQKFSSVLGKNKNIQLVLAGKPGSAQNKIKNKIGISSHKDNIILANYVQPDNLGALFAGAKVFVFPSLYEGFGLPIIEAMSANIPVITSNLSSMPEIAGQGNAVFVDPYQVTEISQALINLLSQPALREKIVANYQSKIKEYNWRKTAEKTLAVYKELGN